MFETCKQDSHEVGSQKPKRDPSFMTESKAPPKRTLVNLDSGAICQRDQLCFLQRVDARNASLECPWHEFESKMCIQDRKSVV